MSIKSRSRSMLLSASEAVLDFRLQRGYHIWRDLRFWAKRMDYNTSVIFDVGANIGQTAEEIHKYLPSSEIHCFEFFPDTFDTLSEKKLPYVTANKIAISDYEGEATYLRRSDSLLNRIEEKPLFNSNDTQESFNTPVSTIDIYSKKANIGEIFLLKTDTEGHDLPVLRGATDLLQKKKVGFVYSECRVNRWGHQSELSALLEFMMSHDYNFVGLYEVMYVHGSKPALNYANALFARGSV